MTDMARYGVRFPHSRLTFANGRPVIPFGSEFALRDGLAEYAWLSGWDVKTEVHLPGWGRIDLLLRSEEFRMAVEIKLDLVRPSSIRKAFQQADTYTRVLSRETQMVLVAADLDREAIRTYEARYPGIQAGSVDQLLAMIGGSTVPGFERRQFWACDRAHSLQEWADAAAAACRLLGVRASPIAPRDA